MRVALLGGLVLAVLAVAAPASAGCWATVGVAPPPAGLGAGEVWKADITVLQHGQTPLPAEVDAKPTLTIVNAESGQAKTFPAKATNRKAGVFTAAVVFPSNGRWSYEVYDGFDNWAGNPEPCAKTHTFGTIDVGGGGSTASSSGQPPSGPAAEPASSSGFPAWPVGGGIAGALAAALAVALLVQRRGQREPASA